MSRYRCACISSPFQLEKDDHHASARRRSSAAWYGGRWIARRVASSTSHDALVDQVAARSCAAERRAAVADEVLRRGEPDFVRRAFSSADFHGGRGLCGGWPADEWIFPIHTDFCVLGGERIPMPNKGSSECVADAAWKVLL